MISLELCACYHVAQNPPVSKVQPPRAASMAYFLDCNCLVLLFLQPLKCKKKKKVENAHNNVQVHVFELPLLSFAREQQNSTAEPVLHQLNYSHLMFYF